MAKRTNGVWRLPLFVAVAGLVLIVGRSLRRDARPWRSPEVVRVSGAAACINYSRSLGGAGAARPDGVSGLLCCDGDLLFVFGEKEDIDRTACLFPYRSADGAVLRFQCQGPRLALNGKVASIRLSEDDTPAWQWLASASRKDLAGVRCIEVSDTVAPGRIEPLKRLPRRVTCLVLEEWAHLRDVLPLFKPEQLFIVPHRAPPEADQDLEALLADQTQVRAVWLQADDVESLAFLGNLPRLERLTLTVWHPSATGPLPAACNKLAALTLDHCHLTDLSAIEHLSQLLELHVTDCQSLTDISALAGFQRLCHLDLAKCTDLHDLKVLAALRDLRWLSLPPTTTQDQFAAVVADHPRLEVLELADCREIRDLSPLRNLPHLRALALTEDPESLAPLKEMKRLRFLTLPKAAFKPQEGAATRPATGPEREAVTVSQLEEALPDCLIVPEAGKLFCLGSGWILLLGGAAVVGRACARLRAGTGRGPS